MKKTDYLHTAKMKIMTLVSLLSLLMISTATQAQTNELYGLWVKRAAFGSGGSASIGSSAVDENGNVYVAGEFTGTLNFSDDLCNPQNFTAAHQRGGFVIKFDSNGKYLWAVTSAQTKHAGSGNGQTCPGSSASIQDYAGGKLLVRFITYYSTNAMLPIGHIVTGPGGGNTKTSTISTGNGTHGNPSAGCGTAYAVNSLQIINCDDGMLETTVDTPFPTGVHAILGRIKNNSIFALHWGSGTVYAGGNYTIQSKVSEYNLTTGVSISDVAYPQQPTITTPGADTRVDQYYALANGTHVLGHFVLFNVVPTSPSPNRRGFILLYNSDFTTRIAMHQEVVSNSYGHAFGGDASSNIYVALNYGYGGTEDGTPGVGVQNTVNNLYGSSSSFSTAPQKNKAIICRLNPNLGYDASSWIFQLGPNSSTNQDEVIVSSLVTEGAYTSVTGRFTGSNINFDPLGNNAAWRLSSAGGYDGFYAVYNNADGHCVYAARIGGTNTDYISTLSLANGNVILGGSYNSPSLQVDPSGRLYPITSDGTSTAGFVALYSPDSDSEPAPYTSSFGDAPESYGTAIHHTYPCLRLGGLDPTKIQESPIYSDEANSDENDDGFTHDIDANGFTNLANNNHYFGGNTMVIRARATNTSNESAQMTVWIDFNQNGVFEASEAITAAVPAGANNQEIVAIFTGVDSKIRHGKTFMRFRLTTDPALDANQPAGLFFDGEVEDYLLNFNLLEVTKIASPTAAKVGDVLTYTINVKNNSPASLTTTEIIDPIPLYTTYVAGSANPSAGASTGNVIIDGQALNAVKWTGSTIAAGATKSYSFKVTLTDAPQLHTPRDSVISNVAYALLNGDSIPSTGANCDQAEVEVIVLDAIDDTAKLWAGKASKINVLSNDEFYGCTPTVAVANGAHGSTSIVNDSVLYTPYDLTYEGPDTVKYSIRCSPTEVDTAKIYIMLYKQPDNIIDVDGDDCFVPGTSFDFNVKQKWSVSGRAHGNTGPLVGDLDGDGIPEIITIGQDLYKLYVTDGATGNLKATIDISYSYGTGGWHPVMTAVMVDADANGRGEIILATSDGNLNSYEVTSSSPFTLTKKWGPVAFTNPTTADVLPQPIVADLNGDGVPELIVYNQIFNALTGVLLGVTENPASTAYVGRNPNRIGNVTTNFMTVADFDGDGLPEIVAGGKVFKVSFNPAKTAVTCSIWRNRSSDIPDGFTAVADVDMDGLLDVVVAYAKADGSTWMGVWSPVDNRLIDNFQIYSNPSYNAQSYPFIGDIDGFVDAGTGKKYPEICVTIVNAVKAYKYDPSTGKYSLKWTLTTSDVSGGTGITLFDFNNDGINELVYRDQTHLRILNGVADGVAPVLADALTASIVCESGTAFEYPVIADTDGDGSANICVTCSTGYGGNPQYLRTYESASRPWSSTRTVWNQVNYEPLYINEDLTVPKYPIPKNMAFDGKYPYNGALIQVPTMVDGNFNIVQVAPDPAVDSVWLVQRGADSVRVYVRVKNLSAKRNVNQDLPVAIYKIAVSADTTGATAGGTDFITKKPVGATILPGNVHTMYFDVIKTKMANQMSVRIQDDGVKYPAAGSFLDCDYSNNVGVFGNLIAFDDRVIGTANTLINLNLIANDLLGSCNASNITVDTIVNKGPRHGTLSIKADKSFDYMPNTNFVGIDSLAYYIKCGSDSSAAKVYIAVLKPGSLNYVACPGATTNMSLTAISGVTYHWYNAQTGGVVVTGGGNTNSLSIIKGSANDIGTWWVEARYGSIIFPRYKIVLQFGTNCGNTPSGCLVDGSLVWKEDFDSYGSGDRAPDPGWQSVGTTTYTYQSTTNFNTILPAAGHYALLKGRNLGSPGVAAWFFSPLDDHTSPTDNTKGYFLNFDATQAAGQYYEFDMTGLCEGTDLIFSAWLMNINPTSWTPSGYVVPIVEFIIEDMSGNRLGVFNTGEILKQNAATWVNYAFPFTVPAGVSDVKVRFINAQLKATGTAGNDISIDDIEVRLCAPPITAYVNGKATDTICSGSAVTLTVDPYDDNQVFVPSGTNLKGYWLRSFTGDVNTPTAWTTVSMSEVTGTAVLTVPPVTDTPPANDTVYYRFVISSVANVDKPNCRAYSAVLPVVVRGHTPNYPDVRLQLCSGLTTQIYLSSYLDTVNFTSVVWSKISTGSPNFVGSTANTTGALNTSDFSLGTHIYEYAMSNICSASGTGRVYVKYTTNPVVPSLIDTIVICQSTPSAAHLQLNQMLGLETGGTWSYDVALSSYVTAKTPPSQFAGAYIFDAATAWYEANYGSLSACKITYNGDINAAAFTFNYTTGPQTCFGNRVRKLVLVITSRVLPLH